MSDFAIQVENLSKRYVLGRQKNRGDGLRHRIEEMVRNPLNLVRSFGSRGEAPNEFWALKDVSFNLKEGEVVGIIGRNGAGKSTLLKVLSRITEPTQGKIRLRGRIASLLEVGTGFHPDLTGRENIFLNGAILGMSRREIKSKFDEIVAFAETEKFLDTPVKRYSSGMYVRLAFAVAAHLEPEILVVDEVLAVGDAQFQKKCMGKMGDVARGGRTILFVSHNMSAIRSLCSRAIMLQGGRVLQTGNLEQTIDRYLADSMNQASAILDVEKTARSGDMGSRVRINRVVFNDGKDVQHGKPLRIDLHFKATGAEDEVSFGIGFCNRDGIRLLTIDTDVSGERIQIKGGTSGVLSISIPVLHLEPDIYGIDLGARSGDNFGLDYLGMCGMVSVVPSSLTPPVIAMRETGRGGYRQPHEWDVKMKGQ